MELIERDSFLDSLSMHFKNIAAGEGHCIFISGEAGIGKTTLVKTFCTELSKGVKIFRGTCDALFTPRPLAPLYDIALQLENDFWQQYNDITDRAEIFSRLFHELGSLEQTSVIVFEDIHWADEATLDFIKFMARRITQLRCLFILTYRDNEVPSQQHLRNMFAQLPRDSFSRMKLQPLSVEAVTKMAKEKGYNGEDVYSVSAGNPFYVNEILASYNTAVPESIRDMILSVYDRTTEKNREVWNLMSVIPGRLEIKYLEKFDPEYAVVIEDSLAANILLIDEGFIFFKHELFRRTIETSLSPLKRISLNKKILDLLEESFERESSTERIVHYAKNSNEHETVVRYAPLAAKQASSLGSHIAASKLYLTAIEYYQGNDKNFLLTLYDAYAYECYLTHQTREAIIYSSRSLELYRERNETEKIADCLRFLSWLWWINSNLSKAESFGKQAIDVLEPVAACDAKAKAFSNFSLLKLFSDLHDDAIYWGEKAITMANELGNKAILSDALGNVGSVKARIPAQQQEGFEMQQQSLDIALQNSYHEHAAKAYTNLVYNSSIVKDITGTAKFLDAGIPYCEENNLDLWVEYMLAIKAKLKMETGNWQEAYDIGDTIIKDEDPTEIVKIFLLSVLATIKMRRGDNKNLPDMLTDAKEKAFETMELQRITQALAAILEYEWITGQQFVEKEALDQAVKMTDQMGNLYSNSELAFWLQRARGRHLPLKEVYEGYATGNTAEIKKAAALWKKLGYPYNEALLLFEGDDEEKRKAITIVHELGATAVHEKMTREMRNSGIKNIPRGIRKTTQANPAFLTGRELDVLQKLKEGLPNKEIAAQLYISAKTVDHHISSILYKLEVKSRAKAVTEAVRLEIIK